MPSRSEPKPASADGAAGVSLFVASTGNEFMHDIAEVFRHGFEAAGVRCRIRIDEVPQAHLAGDVQIIVAPHEFVPLFLTRSSDTSGVAAALEHSYVLNVEQPGSQWFEIACEYACRSRGVFDVSPQGVREFGSRGVPAFLARLGHAPPLESASVAPFADRPIDVLFLGHSSARRDDFFARYAPVFSGLRCHLILSDVAVPRRATTAGYQHGAGRSALLAASRIVLNIHSTDRRYFEAHRAMLALANRCLLITEASLHTQPLQDRRHFVMGELNDLAALCQHYLAAPSEAAAIADAGYDFVREHLSIRATCESMLDRIAALERDSKQRSVRPLDAVDHEAERRRVMERLSVSCARRAAGQRDWDPVPNAAYETAGPPAVSVIVTLYNYAHFIGECLGSVVASNSPGGPVEVVVVDDGSTDGSPALVQEMMERTDQPMLLVRKHTNTGPAAARNLGLECARSDSVFVLDADNWIFPECLRVLLGGLRSESYAAAYGVIRRFDDESGEPLGLMSKFDWDVRQLIRRPYIDAMAMFDRRIVLDVGGYSTELVEHGWFGWEDYDLWLKLAQAGHCAALVPAVLSSYRVHAGSMLQHTNKTSERIAKHFHRKFKKLLDEHPHLDSYFGFPVDGAAPPVPPEPADGGLGAAHYRASLLQAQLDAMYGSASWRITAPLRLAYRWLTGRPQ